MMISESTLRGTCSCGSVSYRAEGPPLIVHACHCKMCQKQSGSTNAVNALIEADRVALISGTIREHLEITPSGKGQKIARCAQCLSAVWSEYHKFSSRYSASILFLRAGTLEPPNAVAPDVHIYVESKQPYIVLPAEIPKHSAFYDVMSLWSQASLERLVRSSRREESGK